MHLTREETQIPEGCHFLAHPVYYLSPTAAQQRLSNAKTPTRASQMISEI